MHPKLVIFDLDGTLIDSKLDLAHAVNAARTHLDLPVLDHERIYSYVGNGAPVLIRRAMGAEASEQAVQDALEYFLAFYNEHKLDHTVLYPGVRETLGKLQESGHLLAILTNKPVRISKAIIDGLGLSSSFVQIYGGNSFEQKKPHPIGIDTLRAETGASSNASIMVGDSAVDIQTARNAAIASCGVTWGFQPETLLIDPPDHTIDRMEQLPALLAATPAIM